MIEVLNIYENHLKGNNLRRMSDNDWPNRKDCYSHILYMIPEIKKFIDENKLDKASRWLGFIQGSLWTNGDFVLSELKDHNREVEKPVVNGRTYPKEIMEDDVKIYMILTL